MIDTIIIFFDSTFFKTTMFILILFACTAVYAACILSEKISRQEEKYYQEVQKGENHEVHN